MSYFAVDIPWGVAKPANIIFDKERKVSFYHGAILPRELRPYQAPDFSREKWQEDEKNGMVTPPTPSENSFTPRPHQKDAAKAIAQAYQNGWGGFLLADKTGVGKTLSALVGIALIAKLQNKGVQGKGKLLVVCPKGVIPQWRQTLRAYRLSHPLLRTLVINYDQLAKLLDTPSAARVAQKRSRKNKQIAKSGQPLVDFDYVIFDESQKLKNFPSSMVSLMATSVAKLNKPYVKDSSPFVIFSTATPGATPLNFSVMSGFMSRLIDPAYKKYVTPDKWGAFLEEKGFAVEKGKSGWVWASIPWYGKNSSNAKEVKAYEAGVAKAKATQRKDSQRIGKALLSKNSPFIMRSPKDLSGWPEQQFIPLPIELNPKQRRFYEEAWTQFRSWLNLTPAKKDPKGALVENLRYRQKTSLLRVETLADFVAEWVDEGNQVYISCEFIETIDAFKEKLAKKKITVAEISGRTADIREEERLRFQKGHAMVAISTVVAGISLHQEEELPDGTKATSANRISIIADIRQNNLDTLQSAGRAHRDGKNSITYIPYIDDSVDKRVVDSFINKTANMKSMLGATTEDAEELERIFRTSAARSTPPNRLR